MDRYNQAFAKVLWMLRSGASWSGHERNCAFLNTGDGRFADVSVASGIDFPDDGRALVATDWDQDGDQDLWISNRNAPRLRFMRNDRPVTNHYLSLRLVGNGTTTNRDAIGARVEVKVAAPGDLPRVKTLRAGEGFLSQSSKWLQFGLGDVTKVENIIVHWPGGKREEFGSLMVDSRYILAQGTGHSQLSPVAKRTLTLKPSEQPLPPASEKGAIHLITALEVPNLTYLNWDGQQAVLQTKTGRPLLINLWASWCAPCLKELREMTQAREAIRKADLDIMALAVDGLSDKETTPQDAAEQLKRIGFPYHSGRASQPLLNALQALYDLQTPMQQSLPVPTSFLIDSKGRLTAIYRGPVDIQVVLRDARGGGETLSERFRLSSVFPGRVLQDEAAQVALKEAEIYKRLRFGRFFLSAGFLSPAAEQFSTVVRLWPESAVVRERLAEILIRQRRFDEAITYLEQASRLNTKSVTIHTNLAGLYRNKKQFLRAIEQYDKAIEFEPGNAELVHLRGTVFRELEKQKKAIENSK